MKRVNLKRCIGLMLFMICLFSIFSFHNSCFAKSLMLDGNVRDIYVSYFYTFDLSKESNENKLKIMKLMSINNIKTNNILSSQQKYKLMNIIKKNNIKITESNTEVFKSNGAFIYSDNNSNIDIIKDNYGHAIDYKSKDIVFEFDFNNMDGKGYLTTIIPYNDKNKMFSNLAHKTFYLNYTDSLLITLSKDKYLIISPY